MKLRSLPVLALLAMSLAGTGLITVSRLTTAGNSEAPPASTATVITPAGQDADSLEGAWRLRCCQPKHWRTCMLQQ